MDYCAIMAGKETSLEIYEEISECIEKISHFPSLVEPIYRKAMTFDETTLDQLRFGLFRLQLHADIHRNEDLEQAQKVRFVAQVLEKIIYGSLLLSSDDNLSGE